MDYKELKECLSYEKKINLGNYADSYIKQLYLIIIRHPAWLRWQYIKYLRLSDNYTGWRRVFYLRKKNKIASYVNIEINCGRNIEKGILFYHNGPIIINSNAKVGCNCKIHGNVCIGNNGKDDKAPKIGDNVEIGVGVNIIGPVIIASGTFIGAGAVVNKDIVEPNTVVCGVPAKSVKNI